MSDPRGDEPTVAGATPDPRSGEATDPRLPEQIAGRWDILALIGTGGMGNVYRAHDRELGETIALKVLRRSAGPGAADALERFRAEVKLARRVTHVNVARTHDIGKHDDMLFLTMELVDGESLGRRVARGALPWRDAVAIARGICAGVGAAHAAGVVHRDLKPDNVMLAGDGRVVVTDFGIAAIHELGSGEDTIEVTGTPAWMAPEQLAGTSDARSDVYAIGEILWTMLTGAHPWTHEGRLQILPRITEPAPSMSRGLAPEPVIEVIERCLARVPADRYADARAVGEALAAAEAADPTAPRRPVASVVAAPPREVRVGVEPIRNLGAAADDFVAAGLVEDLIDVLGRVRDLRVRALGEGSARDDLDVVVAGSLRRAGDMVRIAVRAAGARDGFQIWSQRFDRRLDQILQLSDEVAHDVAAALSATSVRGADREVATDRVVVELYLRARQLVESNWLDDPRPLALYQEALARDPDAPVILSAYATLLARRLGGDDDLRTSAEAEALARRAIAGGGGRAEPWVALSVVFYNQSRAAPALRAARIALERGPGLAEANDHAGRMLLEIDPGLVEATALLERARWANPKLPNTLVDLVRAHALRGDWDRVDELHEHPGTSSIIALLVSRARMTLWRGYAAGDPAPPMPDLARLRWIDDVIRDAFHRGALSDDNAQLWCERVAAMPAGSRVHRFFAQLGTEIALRFGHRDAGWRLLDDAVANGLLDIAWLEHAPLFDGVREDPRFVAARAEVADRAARLLAVWRGPLPAADPDAITRG